MELITRILSLLLLSYPLIEEALSDIGDIEKGVENHRKDVWKRVAYTICVAIIVSGVHSLMFNTDWLTELGKSLIMSVAIFTSGFDYLLNYYRGLPWYFLGKTARSDRFFAGINKYIVLGIRIVIFIGATVIYFI